MKEIPNTTTLVEEPGSRSPSAQKFSISRILAPTDFSPNSEKAVAYAIQLARRVGAKLTLLHVCRPTDRTRPFSASRTEMS